MARRHDQRILAFDKDHAFASTGTRPLRRQRNGGQRRQIYRTSEGFDLVGWRVRGQGRVPLETDRAQQYDDALDQHDVRSQQPNDAERRRSGLPDGNSSRLFIQF